MVIPDTPDGYYLLQDRNEWYIIKDSGAFMNRLLDATGEQKRFEISREGSIAAADYVQKHAALNLKYNEVVPEYDKP